MVTQRSFGLFDRAGLESGNFLNWAYVPAGRAEKTYGKVVQRTHWPNGTASNGSRTFVRCREETTAAGRLRCLRAAPTEALMRAAASSTAPDDDTWNSGQWGPVVDGVELLHPPSQLLAEGLVANVPVLIGSNADEGSGCVRTCVRACVRGLWVALNTHTCMSGVVPMRPCMRVRKACRVWRRTEALGRRFITNTSQMSYPLPINISKRAFDRWLEVSFLHQIFRGNRSALQAAKALYPEWRAPAGSSLPSRPSEHSPWRAAEQILTVRAAFPSLPLWQLPLPTEICTCHACVLVKELRVKTRTGLHVHVSVTQERRVAGSCTSHAPPWQPTRGGASSTSSAGVSVLLLAPALGERTPTGTCLYLFLSGRS
jgi:hypothetical protein